MYFSRIDSKDITFDDPVKRCIRVYRDLYTRVEDDNEQKARVFSDTRLLRIRNTGAEGDTNSEELIRKSDVSVSVETRASISVLCYVTKALVTAEFKEMSNDEFEKRYLGPFDEALKLSNLDVHILSQVFLSIKRCHACGA